MLCLAKAESTVVYLPTSFLVQASYKLHVVMISSATHGEVAKALSFIRVLESTTGKKVDTGVLHYLLALD